MFPALASTVPLLRRGPSEVQLGLDAEGSVVLSGLSEAEILALERLDGSRSMTHVLADGADRFAALVGELMQRGLVVDAHRDSDRPRATVLIDGDGATSRALTDLLRQSGLAVRQGRDAYDDLDLAHRAGRTTEADRVDLVVRIAAAALHPGESGGIPGAASLPVLLRPRSVVIGPFVDVGGPCLGCLDLTRVDHDPAWALVLAQTGRLQEPASPSPLTTMAAALAASRALDYLHLGRRDPGVGALAESVEMMLHPARVVHRTWSRHPRCRRHTARAVADGHPGRETMGA